MALMGGIHSIALTWCRNSVKVKSASDKNACLKACGIQWTGSRGCWVSLRELFIWMGRAALVLSLWVLLSSSHLILSKIYISNTFPRVITLNHTLQFQRTNKMQWSANIDKCALISKWESLTKCLKTFHIIWSGSLFVVFFFFLPDTEEKIKWQTLVGC